MRISVQAEARLRQMLDTALDRSGGLRGHRRGSVRRHQNRNPPTQSLPRRLPHPLRHAEGRQRLRRGGRANLRRIPIADFHANPLPDAAFAALEAFVGAQNELYTQIGAFQKASGVSAALLDSLAQATQFRASEALNFAATMQLAAMPPNGGSR